MAARSSFIGMRKSINFTDTDISHLMQLLLKNNSMKRRRRRKRKRKNSISIDSALLSDNRAIGDHQILFST